MSFLLAPPEIARVEREQARGITSREVVRLFEAKGARLSRPWVWTDPAVPQS